MVSQNYRVLREATGLSLREVARRTGWVEGGPSGPDAINPGRLSIIERGVDPTPAEADQLKRILDQVVEAVA